MLFFNSIVLSTERQTDHHQASRDVVGLVGILGGVGVHVGGHLLMHSHLYPAECSQGALLTHQQKMMLGFSSPAI